MKDAEKITEIQRRWKLLKELEEEYKKIFLKQAGVRKSKWGICINNDRLVPEKMRDCSVGCIRKMRSGLRDGFKIDDMKCRTCPYFVNGRETSWGD